MNNACEIACIGECTVPKDWIGMVKNDINRLYYIHSGEGGYIKDGKRIEFTPNRLYLIPAYSKIRTYAPPENRICHTYADFALVPPIISKDVISIDPHKDPTVMASLGVFIALCKDQSTLAESARAKYLCDTLFFLSSKIAEQNDSSILKDKAIISALNIMHSRISEKLTVADIAEECHMSQEGFIRKFKTHIGETPYNYLKRLKLRVALRIRGTGVCWEEAADAAGYSDASSLLHAIKKENMQ